MPVASTRCSFARDSLRDSRPQPGRAPAPSRGCRDNHTTSVAPVRALVVAMAQPPACRFPVAARLGETHQS
eukprot:4915627-Prymnesium_polylepis.1